MNMRDIKFRAWDKVAKAMSPEFVLFGEFTLMGAVHSWQHHVGNTAKTSLEALDDLEIMQFTGLKDKNGKEIYEGDIVQRGVIVFHNGKFQGQYFSEGVMYELWEDDLCQEKGIEVIGNIHQHPELLKTL